MGTVAWMLSLAGAVVLGVLINDVSACAEYLHRGILWFAARLTPRAQREEAYRAWLGDLATRPPSVIWRTLYALDCIRGGLAIGLASWVAKESEAASETRAAISALVSTLRLAEMVMRKRKLQRLLSRMNDDRLLRLRARIVDLQEESAKLAERQRRALLKRTDAVKLEQVAYIAKLEELVADLSRVQKGTG